MARWTISFGAVGVLAVGCSGKLLEDGPTARYNAIGALDSDGLVFHLSGGADRSGARADAWALDLLLGEWVRVEGPRAPLLSSAAARVGQTIWAFGGTNDISEEVDTTVAWTVRGGPWRETASDGSDGFPTPRREGAMVRLDSGRALLVGGNTDDEEDPGITDAELWGLDVGNGTWTPLMASGDGPTGLQRHAAAHADGVVWVHGGYDADATLQARLWSIDTVTWEWTEHTSANEGPSARADHMLIAYDDQLYVWGGDVDDTDIWVYDLMSSEWTATAAGGPRGRDAFAWDRVQAEPWAVIQGGDSRTDAGYLSDVWILDLAGRTWTELLQPDGRSY